MDATPEDILSLPLCQFIGGIPGSGANVIHDVWGKGSQLLLQRDSLTCLKQATLGHLGGLIGFPSHT